MRVTEAELQREARAAVAAMTPREKRAHLAFMSMTDRRKATTRSEMRLIVRQLSGNAASVPAPASARVEPANEYERRLAQRDPERWQTMAELRAAEHRRTRRANAALPPEPPPIEPVTDYEKHLARNDPYGWEVYCIGRNMSRDLRG